LRNHLAGTPAATAPGTAIFTMVLSKHYGGDPKTAFDTIMSNSILTALTLPVWIAVGLHLIRGSLNY